jgi:four helix bundle protein
MVGVPWLLVRVSRKLRWGEGMHGSLQQQLLDEVFSIVGVARPVVEAVARHDRDLGSQVRRALNSVGLNVAESAGSAGGNARLRFQSALGSLYEARAGLRLGVAWGFVSAEACAGVLAGCDRLGARLYGLARR